MKKVSLKLMLTLANIMILCSVLFVGVWAAFTPGVNFTVTVSYQQNIKVKAYISTNATDGGTFKQNNPTIDVNEATDFKIANSALFLDTTVATPSYPDLILFEGLNDGGHLHFGEGSTVHFYIYVENYNTGRDLSCAVSVDITNDGGETNFQVLTISPKTINAPTTGFTKGLILVELEPIYESSAPELLNKIQINVIFTAGAEVTP